MPEKSIAASFVRTILKYKECTEMPRRLRLILPGHSRHVIVRGVNREPIFCNQVGDYYYLDYLLDAIKNMAASYMPMC